MAIQNQTVIRGFASFDLVVTGLFALPWTAKLLFTLVYELHSVLIYANPPGFVINTMTLAFANIMGLIGMLWALVRLKTPTRDYARWDAIGRFYVAAILLWYIAGSLSPIFLIFVATELIGAIWQILLPKQKQAQS